MSSNKKSPATKEDGKPALVPKLRFPEFRGTEGWEQKEVGEVFQVTRGDVLSMTLVQDEKTDAMPFPVYSSQTKNNGLSGYYSDFLFEGAITWTTDGANAGDVNFRSGKFYCTNVCGVLLSSKGYANACVAALINGVARKYVSYVGNPKLMNGVMSKIPIPLPPLAEQQKIAECLSSVDEVIAAQARKVDALKTHKKGLMQQLFPREGETQPRLRFPEFQNDGEWEPRELSDFITERDEYPKEKVPLFSLTIEDGVTPITERHERSFLVNDEASAYKLVMPNDFAFNPMNLRFGAIGRHSGTEKVAVSKYYNIFSCDETVDSRFCETYFRSDGMVAFYDDMAIGSLIEKRRVHFAAFLKFNIRFPRLLEQQRIASCLSSLDALIAAETQKLEALKCHKRGLMQQLFPSPEEATL